MQKRAVLLCGQCFLLRGEICDAQSRLWLSAVQRPVRRRAFMDAIQLSLEPVQKATTALARRVSLLAVGFLIIKLYLYPMKICFTVALQTTKKGAGRKKSYGYS